MDVARRLVAALLALALVAACSDDGGDDEAAATTTTEATTTTTVGGRAARRLPAATRRRAVADRRVGDRRWPAGVDKAVVDAATDTAFADGAEDRVRATVIVHGGAIVYERYSPTPPTGPARSCRATRWPRR